MKDAAIKAAGGLLLGALITLLTYAILGLVLLDFDIRNWSEWTRAGWLGVTSVILYLWQGGSARSALDRLW